MFLDCVIGRRGILIQLSPSGLAKNIFLNPIAQSLIPVIRANWQSSLKRLKDIDSRAGIDDTNN